MRTFSTWNYGTRQFDYYQAMGSNGTHVTESPTRLLKGSQIGLTPEQFAARLPSGATRIGSGPVAVGEVASTGSTGVPSWLLYGAIALLAWRYFR